MKGIRHFARQLNRRLYRQLQHRLSPSFLIVGAEKGGTTSFFHRLGQHPRLQAPKEKEICFFDKDIFFNRGTTWYHQQFPLAPLWSRTLSFEATPSYLYYPAVPERVAAYDPKMRLIVMVRDPVLRAYSAWNMHRQFLVKSWEIILHRLESQPDSIRLPMLDYYELVRSTDFPGTLRELIPKVEDDRIEPGLLKRGFYARQIARYHRHFPASQMLILESGRCREDPSAELDRVADFLGIERVDWEQGKIAEANHHKREYDGPMPEEAEQMLRELYRQPNEELFAILGKRYPWMH